MKSVNDHLVRTHHYKNHQLQCGNNVNSFRLDFSLSSKSVTLLINSKFNSICDGFAKAKKIRCFFFSSFAEATIIQFIRRLVIPSVKIYALFNTSQILFIRFAVITAWLWIQPINLARMVTERTPTPPKAWSYMNKLQGKRGEWEFTSNRSSMPNPVRIIPVRRVY